MLSEHRPFPELIVHFHQFVPLQSCRQSVYFHLTAFQTFGAYEAHSGNGWFFKGTDSGSNGRCGLAFELTFAVDQTFFNVLIRFESPQVIFTDNLIVWIHFRHHVRVVHSIRSRLGLLGAQNSLSSSCTVRDRRAHGGNGFRRMLRLQETVVVRFFYCGHSAFTN